MKKVLIVFGTRPEAIKMSPLVLQLLKDTKNFNIKVCVTAQHREMLDQVLELFNIDPDYDLNIMTYKQDLHEISSSILLKMNKVFDDFSPDIVLVHGDTSTTFATSLAAYYKKIMIGHIEAGLRTGNLYSPWPEEGNRKLTASITNLHFAPTKLNKRNLMTEGIEESNIYVTGNTVIDALKLIIKKIENNKDLKYKIEKVIRNAGFNEIESKFILITGHRRENFGQGFLNICEALKSLANKNPDVNFLYPLHFNPNVRGPVSKNLSKIENIKLVEPFKYMEFVYLMKKSFLVLTDSGGIQEEAPSLGKPVLVLRDTSERPEAIEAGTAKLIGTSKKTIISEVQNLLDNPDEYLKMSKIKNPFGHGDSSTKIVEILREVSN